MPRTNYDEIRKVAAATGFFPPVRGRAHTYVLSTTWKFQQFAASAGRLSRRYATIHRGRLSSPSESSAALEFRRGVSPPFRIKISVKLSPAPPSADSLAVVLLPIDVIKTDFYSCVECSRDFIVAVNATASRGFVCLEHRAR